MTSPRPVKVVHLITTLDVGGAEMALSRLLPALDRRRVESRVVSMTAVGPVGDVLRAAGIGVDTLAMRRGRPTPGALLRLVRLLRAWQPDVLQTWLYHADLLGAMAARLARVPRLAWNIRSADMQWQHYGRLSRLTQGACARLSAWPDVIVVNSEAGRRHHAAIGYHPRAWCVIPNGVDTEVFRPDPHARMTLRREWGIEGDAPVIGMIARLDPMKDHATFLEAARVVLQARDDVHFVLAGEDVEPARLPWPEGASHLLASRVHCLGRRGDVPRVMAALDVCTLSSMSEGFPNVLVEGMAAGVPCVSTDVGDARRIVEETGLIVPPRDAPALATAWLALVRSPEERRARGRAARERATSEFSLRRAVAAYESLYARLAAPPELPASPS